MSDRFVIQDVGISGVSVLTRLPREDERGWFERVYDTEDLAGLLGARTVAQVNRTYTKRQGSVRGLHVQGPPFADAKIVSCTRGAVFDVAVDLRRGSPTFGQWHGEELSEGNRKSLFIPEGVAHGFQALVDDCELLYVHTAPYDPTAENGVLATDPAVSIRWPLAVQHLSKRDAGLPALGSASEGIAL